LSDWKVEALRMIQEAAALAKVSKNRKIAEATANVVNALADDGLVSSANVQPYALVMNELIASGALRIRAPGSAAATHSIH